jgi:hypothetical protein
MSPRTNRQKPAERPWSVPVPLAEVPDTGRRVELVADAATRAAVAQAAGVPELSRLQATFDLMRQGTEGLHVAGRVSATVGQNCVVTLEPMESTVDEAVDLVFEPPPPEAPAKPCAESEGETAKAGKAEEPPEALQNGVVDLGAVATEFLMLGIDPYPRKPGAVFDAPKPADDPASHPFAALAALKKGSGEKDT